MLDPRSRDLPVRIIVALQTLLAVVFLSAVSRSAWAVSEERLSPIVRAVRGCRPAVVNIQGQKSVTNTASGGSKSSRQVNGMGTGVVIDSRGYILTNHHVVDGVRRINVTLDNGRTYVAKIIARDKNTDLAIIRIRTPSPLPVVRLGSSHDLMVGETVIAVGNAYGYEHTVTRGIISALHRNVQVNETQQYLDLIQTDASINPGNSGGPLLNVDGEMIGVNVAVRAGAQGIGFAIPLNKALEVATRLMSIERIDNHWHGMTPMAIDGPTGPITIGRIDRNSPAQKGGLKRGDLLEQIGSVKIRRNIDVERALLGRKTNERVAVRVRRDDEIVDLEITVASRSSGMVRQSLQATDSVQQATWNTFGMRLEQASQSAMRATELPYKGGMQVTSVRPGSSAAKQGVQEGDILVKLHRWTVSSAKDMRYIVEHTDALARVGTVKFYIVRGEDTFFGHLAIAKSAAARR